ncbi:MAG: 2-hydroxyacid dehydrogenase [Microcoleaceae cyanobacterium]
MKKKCLILNNRELLPEDTLDSFKDRLEVLWYQNPDPFKLTDVLKLYHNTQIIITTYMDLSADNLKILPSLEAIITTTTAVEYIDLDYCRTQGIQVMNTANYTGASVAEYLITVALCIAKKIIPINQKVHQRNFQCFDEIGIELVGKRAGVIGLGNIGTRVAQFAKAFGMEIVYYNRSKKEFKGGQQVDLNTLVSTADFIFVTPPLNQDSYEMIGKKEFTNMKKNCVLVSSSPDQIINFDALADALNNRKILGAGLDLLETDERYLQLPNLILTPRRANATQECLLERRIGIWKDTLGAYLDNQPRNIL